MNPKRPFVFVIMPFSSEWNDAYELGIQPACVAAGAECARIDEQIFSGRFRLFSGESAAQKLKRLFPWSGTPQPGPSDY